MLPRDTAVPVGTPAVTDSGDSGMASHIKIDTKQLADMGTQLGQLYNSLNNGPDIVSSYNGDMGSGDVARTLSDFAGDWSKKKTTLLGQLQELSEAATGAAKATRRGASRYRPLALGISRIRD